MSVNQVKIVTVGDGGVGKTCVLIAYTTNKYLEGELSTHHVSIYIYVSAYSISNIPLLFVLFYVTEFSTICVSDYTPTVFDNYTANVTVNGKVLSLLLWDTAGQEDYDKFRPISYPLTDMYLLCFAIDSPTSYQNVLNKWYQEITYYSPNVPFILVGTKSDLRNDPKTIARLAEVGEVPITLEQGMSMAKELPRCVKYMECSAKIAEGVKPIFNDSIAYVLNSYNQSVKPKSVLKKCNIL